MEKVAVIILNYKLADLTVRCIESVKKSTYKNLQIFIIDNNSGDSLEERVKSLDVTFIQSGINGGYSAGNNAGIKEALKTDAKYIFILNPDTTIEKSTISILVERAKQYNVKILCPKIYFDSSKTIWYAGGTFDRLNVLGSHRGVDEKDSGQYDKDEETDTFTGAAVLMDREVFDTVGLFDERYFLYYEDSDFSFRAKKKGYKIMYIHDAVVYHKNAQSTGLGSPLQDYYITRNRMLFAHKFLPLRTRFALLREALRNMKNPVRRRALFDFSLKRFGKGAIN